jgi:hypothetical protein
MANYQPVLCRTGSVGAFSKHKDDRRVKLINRLQNSSKRNRIFIPNHLPPSVTQAYYPVGSTTCFLVSKGGRRVIADCLPLHAVRQPLSSWRSSSTQPCPIPKITSYLHMHSGDGNQAMCPYRNTNDDPLSVTCLTGGRAGR